MAWVADGASPLALTELIDFPLAAVPSTSGNDWQIAELAPSPVALFRLLCSVRFGCLP